MLDLDESQKPPFSQEEIRILGCLMEKQLTTPKSYPLTMNSLMLACNQKTSREPVMTMNEGDVGHIARSLIEFGFITIQNSGRAQRVEHRVRSKLGINQKQQAILAVLFLRRPQTLNEIKTRTERMADFDGIADVQSILDDWMSGENPMVIRLPAEGGRRENRYFHTLGDDDLEALKTEMPASTSSSGSSGRKADCCAELLERIEALEKRLADLEELI
ncbi:MAG: YceH family protein [Thiolinea sp.]